MTLNVLSLRRLLIVGALTGLAVTNVWSTSGSQSFADVDYTGGASGEIARAAANPASLAATVQRAVSNFAVIPNAEGATLLPRGAVCDSVEIQEGMMTVRITLPEGAQFPGRDLEEEVQGVIQTQFQSMAQLRGTRVLARIGSQGEYRPLFELGTQPPPPPPINKDIFEPNGPGPQPPAPPVSGSPVSGAVLNSVPGETPVAVAEQPQGVLSGRTVFMYGGHGRTWRNYSQYWSWQRPILLNMNEDTANWDQQEFLAHWLFNAGATVVTFRPIGNQPNEVVLDNTSPQVTYSGAWADSGNPPATTPHWGGTPIYRYANVSTTETATATYTPNIPQAGFYPVYTWVYYGSDRVNQLYRIRHVGGEAQVHVNHRRVGVGWVWLGTYHFDAGSNAATGSVVISNQVPSGTGVVIADGIRFGNGMGDVDRGGGVSGLRREEECTRYWIQRMMGTPDASSVWDGGSYLETDPVHGDQADESDTWNAPPRMAARMTRDDGQGFNGQIYIGLHSNADASSARGCEGLITGSPTPNQAAWAALVSGQIENECAAEDTDWPDQWHLNGAATYTGGYGEISEYNFGNTMCATIAEVAYHDNVQDSTLMRDPRCRSVIGRAITHAIIQYFHTYDTVNPLTVTYAPEPPVRFVAKNSGSGDVALSWQPGPTGGYRGNAATSYIVYRSADALGWGNPVSTVSTSTTVTGLTPGQTCYFRVVAVNAGGVSFPTEALAVRVRSVGTPQILIVNGYDRCDYLNDQLNDLPPMQADRIRLRHNNSYDYVVQHAQAIAAHGMDFDSCANEAVSSGDVALGAYKTVVWILGEESTVDKTFDAAEQTAVTNFLNTAGKSLFVSGSEMGFELVGQGAGAGFFNNTLHAGYAADSAGSHDAAGVPGSIFESIASLTFDNGTIVYNVNSPDALSTSVGSVAALDYSGGGPGLTQLDSMDTVAAWWDPNTSGSTNADPACTFTVSTATKHEGTGSGDLYYVWGTGNLIRDHNSVQPSFADTQQISMWVYGDNSGNTVRISVRDADQDLWMGPPMTVNFTGWQQYVWDNPNSNHTLWATVGNGTYDAGNVLLESIRVDKGGSSPASGHLYFDDFVTGTPGGSSIAALQYPSGLTNGQLVVMGFPFESITSATVRNQIMAAALDFFGTTVPVELSGFAIE